MIKPCLLLILALIISSCQPVCYEMEPQIPYFPQARQLQYLPSPFEKLSHEELQEEWAKEVYIGRAFGHEMDLYRAITSFKRALFLLPAKRAERRSQIEFYIFESYYLGRKYQEAMETFEEGTLVNVPANFPAYRELGIMLYECYIMTGHLDKACRILNLLERDFPDDAPRLELWSSFLETDFDRIADLACSQPDGDAILGFLDEYHASAKSVEKARTLNALLPGLGYLYVGQKQAAVTSFLINALFTGAAYCFAKNHNIPAAIITASLESGWYIGGINGAGLAAQEYNKRLYETTGKEFLVEHRLIPFLTIQTAF